MLGLTYLQNKTNLLCLWADVLHVKIHCAPLSVFQTAIANASTLAEVERLKGLLQAGQIPGRERKPGDGAAFLS